MPKICPTIIALSESPVESRTQLTKYRDRLIKSLEQSSSKSKELTTHLNQAHTSGGRSISNGLPISKYINHCYDGGTKAEFLATHQMIFKPETFQVIDQHIALFDQINELTTDCLQHWYNYIKLDNPDYIVFSIGSGGSEHQMKPPFIQQNPELKFAVLNIDPCDLNWWGTSSMTTEINYSKVRLGFRLRDNTYHMAFLKRITNELVADGKKVILMTFPSPLYCSQIKSWLKENIAVWGEKFAYVWGYFSTSPIFVWNKDLVERIDTVDIEKISQNAFNPENTSNLPILDGMRSIANIAELKITDLITINKLLFLNELEKKVSTLTREEILDLFSEMKKQNGKFNILHTQRNPLWDSFRLFFKSCKNSEESYWHTASYQKTIKILKRAYINAKNPINAERTEEEKAFIDYVRGNSPIHREETATHQQFYRKD